MCFVRVLKKPLEINIDLVLPILMLIFYCNDYLIKYVLIFVSMILHEFAHILIAIPGGGKPIRINISAIGLNAQVEGIYIKPFHKFLVNLGGPFMNIFLALVCYISGVRRFFPENYINFFIYSNIALAIFNMLPIMPLDGGRITRDIFIAELGFFKGNRYIKGISFAVLVTILSLGLLFGIGYGGSLVIVLASGYLLYFQKDDRVGEWLMNIKNLLCKRRKLLKKGIYPVRGLVALENIYLKDIIKNMDFDKFHIIYMVDKSLRLGGVYTEQDILDVFLKSGDNIKLDELEKLKGDKTIC